MQSPSVSSSSRKTISMYTSVHLTNLTLIGEVKINKPLKASILLPTRLNPAWDSLLKQLL